MLPRALASSRTVAKPAMSWRSNKFHHLIHWKCEPRGKSGKCIRSFLLAICILQLLTTLERQIFDFLGYMWTPILLNFVHSLFAIFGIFGTWTRRRPYLFTFICWNVVWVAWNVLVMCLYLEVGSLSTDLAESILSLGTGSYSWWWTNGAYCRPKYSTNVTLVTGPEDLYRPLKPVAVIGCLMDYRYVEALHAAVQVLLSLSGIPLAIVFSRIEDEDPLGSMTGGYSHKSVGGAPSLFSLEMSNRGSNLGGGVEDTLKLGASASDLDSALGYDPRLTPRRVKRRSVTRSSGRSQASRSSRSSRSSRRKRRSRDALRASNANPYSINPVSEMLDTSSNDEAFRHHRLGHINHAYQANSRPGSVYSFTTATSMEFGITLPSTSAQGTTSRPKSALSSYSNFHPGRTNNLQQLAVSSNASNGINKFGTNSTSYSRASTAVNNLNRFAHSPELPRKAVSHNPAGMEHLGRRSPYHNHNAGMYGAHHSETPI
ncbi:unnamed protein product [Cyprideis torosa]|uniref:Sodium/potassium-transporting ATPase subunit beta-1-interacting protein n=1 Tax=Cyprideis torosa TaxID=163714 RepID=A0A7R8WKF8_9CRUS|nr:unnamed protein product [Cyprideis torosa]CAG0897032.1 unnamed protein product [Cyprideis torosa]